MTIADRIKEERIKLGLTPQEFAKKIGTDPANISRWEAEKINISTDSAIKLANAFGVTLDYLLLGKQPEKFITVFSIDGVAKSVACHETLDAAVGLIRWGDQEVSFDPDAYDIRVFDSTADTERANQLVFSLFGEEEMEEVQ